VSAPHGAMPGARLGAVLFDMDGLLIDSEPLWTVAENEVAVALDGEFTPEIKAAIIGKALPVAVPILLQGLDTPAARAADPREVGQRLLVRVAGLFAANLPLQPGAWRLLEEITSAGVPTGLVSSSYRLLVDTALAVLGRDRFSVTVAGDEVEHGKPAPDPYLTAAARLGLEPARCVVLEDSIAGIRSATAAGCPCVLVPTFPTEEVPSGVTLHRSLEDIDVAALAAIVERSAAA
jgi:HAD superfamily hydrolase (TIGR01509 family)